MEYQSKLAAGIGGSGTWVHDTYGKAAQYVTLFGVDGRRQQPEQPIKFGKARKVASAAKFGADLADIDPSQPSTSSAKPKAVKRPPSPESELAEPKPPKKARTTRATAPKPAAKKVAAPKKPKT